MLPVLIAARPAGTLTSWRLLWLRGWVGKAAVVHGGAEEMTIVTVNDHPIPDMHIVPMLLSPYGQLQPGYPSPTIIIKIGILKELPPKNDIKGNVVHSRHCPE